MEVIRYLFDKCVSTGENVAEQTVFISHGDCLEDAKSLEKMVREQLHPKDAVIGAHSGPGTLALFLLGNKR